METIIHVVLEQRREEGDGSRTWPDCDLARGLPWDAYNEGIEKNYGSRRKARDEGRTNGLENEKG
jgi:hypothetical protein